MITSRGIVGIMVAIVKGFIEFLRRL